MNLMAFLLSANNNPQVDKIQIPFGTVDFQPHQSSFMQVFKSMEQDMDLTIGSLNFCVGSLGLIHLSGIMNSTAFSLSTNSNPQVDEIQIPFGTIDFKPHQSSFMQVFKSMERDMDLTFGSLNFCVG
jgi:hypothetical protein